LEGTLEIGQNKTIANICMSERMNLFISKHGNTPIARRCFQVVFFCLMAAGLGGCATNQNMMRFEQAHVNAPIKTLVMESPVSIDAKRLQAVLAPDIKPALPASAGLIAQGEKHAQEHALASMEKVLGEQARFDVINPPAQENQAIDKIREKKFDSALTQEEADRLRAATGADALLRFGITDYGLTPKSWRNSYIAFEVTSTLAIAGVIAYSGSVAAKTAAGAYLAQEGVEEAAESYAGFWALDVVNRPVRIEAELVRLDPVATVWKASDTGLSDVSLSRLTRKVASIERNNQLDQSTDHAVKDVVSDLAAAMGKKK
jgi:hypothetical protein